jgi:hypothetical protein
MEIETRFLGRPVSSLVAITAPIFTQTFPNFAWYFIIISPVSLSIHYSVQTELW